MRLDQEEERKQKDTSVSQERKWWVLCPSFTVNQLTARLHRRGKKDLERTLGTAKTVGERKDAQKEVPPTSRDCLARST